METKSLKLEPRGPKYNWQFKRILPGGKFSRVYVSRYRLSDWQIELVSFPQPTRLLDWCQQRSISEAFSGGFFDRGNGRALGEVWIDGQLQQHTPAETTHSRGSLLISRGGSLRLAPRFQLPDRPQNSLLQAGPLLVDRGEDLILTSTDPESFSATSASFDSDITKGRYPRGAIGLNSEFLWTVAVDGYSQISSGMTFTELSELFISLGADSALALDGGGSVSMISDSKLINKPRTPDHTYPRGRLIYNAITLRQKPRQLRQGLAIDLRSLGKTL